MEIVRQIPPTTSQIQPVLYQKIQKQAVSLKLTSFKKQL
jgi:hypothetical protein